MKRVITVHVANTVFQIEEDAYTYLNNVMNNQWKKEELEMQVSERLQQKLSGNKEVITYPDVVDILYQMGFSAADSQPVSQPPRKLYRQTQNKMIGGVCTGLGEYFDVDPVAIRIIFLIAFFLGSM
ncbi:MAG: PspC domain-containing protein, partial [Bacteroidales bacterium]|nr:PspC domain-containing protein [Bacteroidales bacterium]